MLVLLVVLLLDLSHASTLASLAAASKTVDDCKNRLRSVDIALFVPDKLLPSFVKNECVAQDWLGRMKNDQKRYDEWVAKETKKFDADEDDQVLAALAAHPTVRRLYNEFSKQEASTESYDFIVAVNAFKANPSAKLAAEICKEFVAEDAKRMVNLAGPQFTKLRKGLGIGKDKQCTVQEKVEAGVFDEAYAEIAKLVKGIFTRARQHPGFKQKIAGLIGDVNVLDFFCNDEKAAFKARQQETMDVIRGIYAEGCTDSTINYVPKWLKWGEEQKAGLDKFAEQERVKEVKAEHRKKVDEFNKEHRNADGSLKVKPRVDGS